MICQVSMILSRGALFMSQTREKFATQVNSKILLAVRALAEEEGRQLQALVDEALADLIEKHKNAKPRSHVMGLYLTADDEESYVFVANLYNANQFRFDKLVPWLRAHVEKRT